MLVPDTEFWHSVYETAAVQWQSNLQAFFSVKYLPLADIQKAVQTGDYQMAILPYGFSEDDVYAALCTFSGTGSKNFCRFSDSGYDALLADISSADSSTRRLSLSCQAESALAAAWPLVPLYESFNCFRTTEGISGIAVSGFGPVLDFDAAKTE